MGKPYSSSSSSNRNNNWPKGAEYVGLPAVDGHTVNVYQSGNVKIGCKTISLQKWALKGREIAKENGVEYVGRYWLRYLDRLETAARLLGQEPFELAPVPVPKPKPEPEPEGWDWEYTNDGSRWVCRGESPMKNGFGWFCGSRHEGGYDPSPFPDLGIPRPYCRSVKGLVPPKEAK